MELKIENRKQALVIVAHPDDETIWIGGTIARHKNVQWTIFALCRKSDQDRMPKFMRVAKHYGARGIICDLEDEGILSVQQSIPQIIKIIQKELLRKTFDILFTHGANGEYGHPRHQGVHLAVKQMLAEKQILAKDVFFFSYFLDKQKKIAVPQQRSPFQVELSNSEWEAKRNVIKQLYGFKSHIFENRSCSKIESFSVLGRA